MPQISAATIIVLLSGVVKLIDIFIPDIPESVQLRIDIDDLIAKDILNDDHQETGKKKVNVSTMTDKKSDGSHGNAPNEAYVCQLNPGITITGNSAGACSNPPV